MYECLASHIESNMNFYHATGKAPGARLPYLLTRMFNLASCPAASIPCGLSALGLPIGLQIGSRPGGEETIFKAARITFNRVKRSMSGCNRIV